MFIFAKIKLLNGLRKEKKEESFIKKPFYKGGDKAMSDFIRKNLKYPKPAYDQKIQGMVVLRCEIDFKGLVTDVKVLKSLGGGCDEEAVRVARLLEFQVPKSPKGLKVTFHKDLRIPFQIFPVRTESQTTSLQLKYQVVSTPSTTPVEKKKENVITYTISY